MKKTLKLTKTNGQYEIREGEQVLISFECAKKTIKGKDIFDKIYIKSDKAEKTEITLEKDPSLISSEDTIVFDRLRELFHDIDENINNTLFPKTSQTVLGGDAGK
jgi:hypothetical protein